jgi:hypothetical protein
MSNVSEALKKLSKTIPNIDTMSEGDEEVIDKTKKKALQGIKSGMIVQETELSVDGNK